MNEQIEFIKQFVTLPDGTQFAHVCNPFQWEDFCGLASKRFAVIVRPRGHSKTFDIAAWSSAELVTSTEQQRIYNGAVDSEQAGILFEDVVRIFRNHSRLRDLVNITKRELKLKHSPRSYMHVLEFHPESTLGKRPTRLYFDELGAFPPRGDAFFYSMFTALVKSKESKLGIISSPGWNTSGLLYRILSEARGDPNWYVSERGPCASWITEEERNLYKRYTPDVIFQRDYMGRWVDTHGAYFPNEIVDACFSYDIPSGEGARVQGLDIGITGDKTAICVIRLDPKTELVIVEAFSVFDPKHLSRVDLMDVEEECFALARKYNCRIYYDPYQSIGLTQRLQSRGVQVVEYKFSAESRQNLFGNLADLIHTGRLRIRPDTRHAEDLKQELKGLQVELLASGRWRVGHRTGMHDDLTVSLALACMGLPAIPKMDISPWAGGRRDTAFLMDDQPPKRDPGIDPYNEGHDINTPWGSGGGSVDWSRAW